MTSTTAAAPAPWYAAYPAPDDTAPRSIARSEVLEMLKGKGGDSVPGKDYLIVDVRRDDHKGGNIRGSINLPAQSLYPSIPTLYRTLKAAGVRKVIWYCGSCGGRGIRSAGWLSDHLKQVGDDEMQNMMLSGGIKGWVAEGGEYLDWMDEYDDSVWGGQKQA